ncbi:hypothetical protein BBK36DRAFT_1145535 [Trichoderma citrinoviride]|uniref:Uncharacterized protein n=1 Tax=Trichoderma citrinoviride TaxID=58853 RepID=A0A2T4AX42_9HYPO|nr:hypothetical protein BBK36DRAFT_1145535 [Trichoderma citrinoviride]PTB61623.1 hypothetical protein BBK36DRAFT_1145535 [Trichoderma citrinoviride]
MPVCLSTPNLPASRFHLLLCSGRRTSPVGAEQARGSAHNTVKVHGLGALWRDGDGDRERRVVVRRNSRRRSVHRAWPLLSVLLMLSLPPPQWRPSPVGETKERWDRNLPATVIISGAAPACDGWRDSPGNWARLVHAVIRRPQRETLNGASKAWEAALSIQQLGQTPRALRLVAAEAKIYSACALLQAPWLCQLLSLLHLPPALLRPLSSLTSQLTVRDERICPRHPPFALSSPTSRVLTMGLAEHTSKVVAQLSLSEAAYRAASSRSFSGPKRRSLPHMWTSHKRSRTAYQLSRPHNRRRRCLSCRHRSGVTLSSGLTPDCKQQQLLNSMSGPYPNHYERQKSYIRGNQGHGFYRGSSLATNGRLHMLARYSHGCHSNWFRRWNWPSGSAS